jgi:hypothetical protein
VFLMSSTRVRLRFLGVNPLQGSSALDSQMGTAYGIYPWVALVMGNLMGAFEQTHFSCCILYIEQWGFRCFMIQAIVDGDPRASRPWSDTYVVVVSTTDDLFHALKTIWGPDALRSVTDSTEQLVWCLMNMWSMLHVISVIYYLTRICICTSYYCELVVGLRAQFYTLLEVWGDWE